MDGSAYISVIASIGALNLLFFKQDRDIRILRRLRDGDRNGEFLLELCNELVHVLLCDVAVDDDDAFARAEVAQSLIFVGSYREVIPDEFDIAAPVAE